MFEGPVAIAFVRGDAAGAAKALRDFGRNNPALVLKGGLLGARIITAVEIEALAELPSRDVLLAQVAGVFQAPLTKAAGLFQAFTRNFAYGVQGADRPARRRPGTRQRPKKRPPTKRRPTPPKPRHPRAEAPAAEAPAAEPPAAEATEPETAPEPEASSDAEAPAADETAPEPESAESE